MVLTDSLHINFLEHPMVYDAMQMRWYDLVNDLSLAYDFSCKPYLNPFLANGEKDRDGNPIFNTYVASSNRAVRIIQIPKEEAQEIYIQACLNIFGKEENDPGIDELVIHLVYSETAKAIAKNWIKAWLVDDISKAELEIMTDEQSILCD